MNILTNNFSSGSGKNTYSQCVFITKKGDDFTAEPKFAEMLENREFSDILSELIDFGISRYFRDYSDCYRETDLVLYQKYTYEDACRLLNWEKNEVPLNIGGYKYEKKTKTFPVFINYDKRHGLFVGDVFLLYVPLFGDVFPYSVAKWHHSANAR